MRSIGKKSPAILAGILALCALTAASASAAQWYVGGKALTGSEKLAETVKIEEAVKLSAPQIEMTYKCSTVTLEKGEITAPGIAKFTPRLTGCETTKPATGCGIESAIRGFPVEAALTKGLTEDTATITGSGTKKNVWEIEFGDSDVCAFNYWAFDLRGHVTLALTGGQTEAAEQTASFLGEKETPRGLQMDGTEGGEAGPITITGKLKLKLASGKAWSFH
jgi:hypothetical protein